jgi:hypothetical protein
MPDLDLDPDVPRRLGDGQGTLAGFARAPVVTASPVIAAEASQHVTQPSLVANCFGQLLRSAQMFESLLESPRLLKVHSQRHARVDHALAHLAGRWQVREGIERLLEVRDSFVRGRATTRPGTRLLEIRRCLVPDLGPQAMVSEPLDVLGEPVAMQHLDGVHQAGVECPTPLLQQAAVGHFVGQRVLERVLQLRKQCRLIEELGRLEPCQPLA